MSTTAKKPEVGMPATYSIGADHYPYTVVAVSPSGHKVTMKEDRVRHGVFEAAVGEERVVYRNAKGDYKHRGHGFTTFGKREYRMDPSF